MILYLKGLNMKTIKIDRDSPFQLLNFNDNPNVGVYCRTNDNIAFIQMGLSKKTKKKITNSLNVDIVELRIYSATIIGSLLTMNSNGAVVTDFVDKDSLKSIEEQNLDVYVIKDKINAVGNDILVNDNGALVHPSFKDKTITEIKKILKVPVFRGTIASLNTVGMAAVVTNKGLLCHPKVTELEKKHLEEIFCVDVMIGTINHGVPFIGSGLVANSKGALVGDLTTGIELGRIEEALNLF